MTSQKSKIFPILIEINPKIKVLRRFSGSAFSFGVCVQSWMVCEGSLVNTVVVVLLNQDEKCVCVCVFVAQKYACVHIQTSNVGVGITQSSEPVWEENPACSVT